MCDPPIFFVLFCRYIPQEISCIELDVISPIRGTIITALPRRYCLHNDFNVNVALKDNKGSIYGTWQKETTPVWIGTRNITTGAKPPLAWLTAPSLTTPRLYPKYWLIIKNILWHYVREISQMLMNLIRNMCSEITFLKLLRYLPRANDLNTSFPKALLPGNGDWYATFVQVVGEARLKPQR